MSFDPAAIEGGDVIDLMPQRQWFSSLDLQQLTTPTMSAFWTDPATQAAVLATALKLRAELQEAEREHEGEGHAIDIAGAQAAGPRTPLYDGIAKHLYRRAFAIANDVTDIKGAMREAIATRIVDEVLGLGPLEPLLQDPLVTDVMVNSPTAIFFDREGVRSSCPAARFRDDDHLYDVVSRYLRSMNEQLTPMTPQVDGELPDGSRINVTHPMVTGSVTVTIRKFPPRTWTLVDLLDKAALTEPMALDLATLVRGRASMLVAGGTGTGKTTLLNAMSGCIHLNERIITVEDSRELRLHPSATNVIHAKARRKTATMEALTMKDLVKNALRQFPDRIIVGEVRDGVVIDMLQAASTGHEGSMSTIHANSVEDTLHRIALLSAQSGIELTDQRVRDAIGVAIDVIVSVQRFGRERRVTEISELCFDRATHEITINRLWEWDHDAAEHRKVGNVTARLARRLQIQSLDAVTRADLDAIAEAARAADEARLAMLMSGGRAA